MKGPFEVRLEMKANDRAETKLQALLDDLYEFGVLSMKPSVKHARVNVKPYNRNTFEVFVVFDE